MSDAGARHLIALAAIFAADVSGPTGKRLTFSTRVRRLVDSDPLTVESDFEGYILGCEKAEELDEDVAWDGYDAVEAQVGHYRPYGQRLETKRQSVSLESYQCLKPLSFGPYMPGWSEMAPHAREYLGLCAYYERTVRKGGAGTRRR